MSKKTDTSYFLKVRKDDLQHGVIEAVVLAFIAEFETNHKECFASRDHIGKSLGVSPKTIQRTILKLTKIGLVTVQKQGRKRIVKLSKKVVKLTSIDSGQSVPDSGQNDQGKVVKLTHYSDKYYSDKFITDNLNINTYTHVHVDHDLNLDPVGVKMAQRVKDDGFTLKGWWDGLSAQERDELVTYTARVANPYEKNMLGSDLAAPSRSALSVLFNHSAKLDQLKASLPD